MKVKFLGDTKIIMSNPTSKHNYFAWPTVTRLQNGKIAVVSSGYRLRHICPFGKTVISYSEDGGETYTAPAPIIDTVLDDRDGGIVPFGKSGVIVTSFNNTVEFQRDKGADAYTQAYLDSVTPEREREALGATFRISNDGGVTFGKIFKSPITSPHGPVELSDGRLLWVGRTYSPNNAHRVGIDQVEAHIINPDGSMTYVGCIENIVSEGEAVLSCEPHTIVLEGERLLTHIRVQSKGAARLFTVYQSVSEDNGKTWSTPVQILEDKGGSPAHLLRHSSGTLICTYGYRESPYGVRVMFSRDDGATWEDKQDIYVNGVTADLGYPSTVELDDGSLLTVFYAHTAKGEPAVIMQQKWQMEDSIK